MGVRFLRRVKEHPKGDAFLGFYDVITRKDWELYECDLDWTLHLRSVYAFAQAQGLITEQAVAELAEIDALWRKHPDAFDRASGTLISRADLKKEMDGWVMDESGRPVPIPPDHWWWRRPQR